MNQHNLALNMFRVACVWIIHAHVMYISVGQILALLHHGHVIQTVAASCFNVRQDFQQYAYCNVCDFYIEQS